MKRPPLALCALLATASSAPAVDYPAVLIARNVATGVHLERGRPVFPEEKGNGVRLL
jgi:hypothetical protein